MRTGHEPMVASKHQDKDFTINSWWHKNKPI
jgi:hypothetical protein